MNYGMTGAEAGTDCTRRQFDVRSTLLSVVPATEFWAAAPACGHAPECTDQLTPPMVAGLLVPHP